MKVFKADKGQGLVEYAFILALVVLVVIAVITVLGPTVGNLFTNVNANIEAISYIPQMLI